MKYLDRTIAGLSALALLSACAQPPMGPSVAVMPGPNKPFEVFQQDQAVCKDYASQQVSGQAEAANNQAVGGAILGTALGAGLGAAIGGGRGAAIGAASGAGIGTAYGANSSAYANMSIQQRYDIAFHQCMYSHGDQVPGYQPAPAYGPPAGYGPPPPPPGT